MFKLILSPEFGERLNLKELTRQLMYRVAADLRLPLEWVAIAHFNTEHPHAHVLLRGVAEGKEIHLPNEYVKAGIRKHAEDLCTARLAGCGKRSETRYGRNVLSVFSACVESTNNKPICTATFHPNRVFERITRCGEFEQWWMRR